MSGKSDPDAERVRRGALGAVSRSLLTATSRGRSLRQTSAERSVRQSRRVFAVPSLLAVMARLMCDVDILHVEYEFIEFTLQLWRAMNLNSFSDDFNV